MNIIIILGAICFIVGNFIKYYIKGSLTQLDKTRYSITNKLPKTQERLGNIMVVTYLIMWVCIILVVVNFLIKLFN